MTLITTSPTQANAQAWRDERVGRFTASTLGKLMTEPRSLTAEQKQAKANGLPVFGDTALQLIASKAAERLAGTTDANAGSRSMDRGTILEHAAVHILSRCWRPIDHATFMPFGVNAGATPDGLTDEGEATVDIKCPESFADVLRFDLEVHDGDFASLEAWNKLYAWQVMAQAKAAGVTRAWLVYFTDRMPVHRLSADDLDEVQHVIDWHLERMAEGREYPFAYRFASDGFAFVAKCFELTPERSERIDRVLLAAEVHVDEMLSRTSIATLPKASASPAPAMRVVSDEPAAPAAEAKEAQPDPGAQADRGRLDQLRILLANAQREAERIAASLESPLAQHGAKHALGHLANAVAVVVGTVHDINPEPRKR